MYKRQGGIIESDEAISKVYKAKERSFKSPLIVLVSDVSKIEKIAYIEERNREKIEKLIKEFWPGGLTIILNKKEAKEILRFFLFILLVFFCTLFSLFQTFTILT